MICRPSRGSAVCHCGGERARVPCSASRPQEALFSHRPIVLKTDRDQISIITVTATANNTISMGSNIPRVAEHPVVVPATAPTDGRRLTAAVSCMNEPDTTLTRIQKNKERYKPVWDVVLNKYISRFSKPSLGEDVEDVPESDEDDGDEGAEEELEARDP